MGASKEVTCSRNFIVPLTRRQRITQIIVTRKVNNPPSTVLLKITLPLLWITTVSPPWTNGSKQRTYMQQQSYYPPQILATHKINYSKQQVPQPYQYSTTHYYCHSASKHYNNPLISVFSIPRVIFLILPTQMGNSNHLLHHNRRLRCRWTLPNSANYCNRTFPNILPQLSQPPTKKDKGSPVWWSSTIILPLG